MVNLPFIPARRFVPDSPEPEVFQLFSSESAYSFELEWPRKVAENGVADFSHPA